MLVMTADRHQPLWNDYRRTRDTAARNRLVEAYLPLAGRAASAVLRGKPWLRLDHDDLTSAGVVGLIQAVERYDPGYGCRPITYLYRRARGAVLDWLRESGATTRSRCRGRGVWFLSLEGFCEAELDGREGHCAMLAVEHDFGALERRDELDALVRTLSDRERQVLGLRYDGGLSRAAAAAALGLTENYITILCASALMKMRRGAGGS